MTTANGVVEDFDLEALTSWIAQSCRGLPSPAAQATASALIASVVVEPLVEEGRRGTTLVCSPDTSDFQVVDTAAVLRRLVAVAVGPAAAAIQHPNLVTVAAFLSVLAVSVGVAPHFTLSRECALICAILLYEKEHSLPLATLRDGYMKTPEAKSLGLSVLDFQRAFEQLCGLKCVDLKGTEVRLCARLRLRFPRMNKS